MYVDMYRHLHIHIHTNTYVHMERMCFEFLLVLLPFQVISTGVSFIYLFIYFFFVKQQDPPSSSFKVESTNEMKEKKQQ